MTVRIPKIIKPSGIGNILIQQTPEGDYKIPVSIGNEILHLPVIACIYIDNSFAISNNVLILRT